MDRNINIHNATKESVLLDLIYIFTQIEITKEFFSGELVKQLTLFMWKNKYVAGQLFTRCRVRTYTCTDVYSSSVLGCVGSGGRLSRSTPSLCPLSAVAFWGNYLGFLVLSYFFI